MNRKRIVALTVAALVAGLVVGNMASAFAVRPALDRQPVESASCGSGLRLGPMMRAAGGRMVDVVANLTGLSVDEIADRRASGESIATIAESAGVSADKVVNTTLDVRKKALNKAVANGDLTREQADAALERMRERLTERVTSTERGRRMGGRGGQAGGACGGEACSSAQ